MVDSYNRYLLRGRSPRRYDMRFNVAQLLKEGVGARRSYAIDETLEPLAETGTTRVRGSVTVTRIDRGVWASGPFETNAFSACARCLTLVEHPVRFRVDEEFLPTIKIDSGTPPGVRSAQAIKEGVFTLDDHHNLDITEAVRQYVVINLPMKPLCRRDCAGLCPSCGDNLNDHQCGCSAGVDSRWSPLLEMLAAGGRG